MIFWMIPIIFKIKHSEAANGDVKKMFFKCLQNSQENTWVKCVLANFAKFWRTPFLQSTSGRLLLNTDNIWKKKWLKMSTYFRLEEFSNTSKILAQRKVSIASNWAFRHPNILTSYVSAINEKLLTDTSNSDL